MQSLMSELRSLRGAVRTAPIVALLFLLALGQATGVNADDQAPTPSPAAAQPSGPSAGPEGSKPVAGGLTMLGKQAGWRHLYPGLSTKAEVVKALGEPVSSAPDPTGTTRLVFGPDADLKFNSVYVDDKGVVRKIGWARFEQTDKLTYPDLLKAFAEPTKVSPFSAIRMGQTYKFPEGVGLWGAMDSISGSVGTLIFYDPKDKVEIPIPAAPMR